MYVLMEKVPFTWTFISAEHYDISKCYNKSYPIALYILTEVLEAVLPLKLHYRCPTSYIACWQKSMHTLNTNAVLLVQLGSPTTLIPTTARYLRDPITFCMDDALRTIFASLYKKYLFGLHDQQSILTASRPEAQYIKE
jgi:hypothetical protein